MSEAQRQTVYLVVASPLGHQFQRKIAINRIGQRLSELGFVVDAPDIGPIPETEQLYAQVIFSEHQLGTPMQVNPTATAASGEPRIRPPVVESVISHNHVLQISVIGNPNTGKTFFSNVMSQTLEQQSPMFLSLDLMHHAYHELPHDGLDRLKERVQIKIVEKVLTTVCTLSSILETSPVKETA